MAAPAFGNPRTPSGELFDLICAAAGLHNKSIQSLTISFAYDREAVVHVDLLMDEATVHEALKKHIEQSFDKSLESVDETLNGPPKPKPKTVHESVRDAIMNSKSQWLKTVGLSSGMVVTQVSKSP